MNIVIISDGKNKVKKDFMTRLCILLTINVLQCLYLCKNIVFQVPKLANTLKSTNIKFKAFDVFLQNIDFQIYK